MTIYGLPNNEVHDDQGNQETRTMILKRFPNAEILDRAPLPYETYIHGTGYVKDTDQEIADQSEAERQSGIQTEQEASGTMIDTPAEAKAKINSVYQPVFDIIADIEAGEKTDAEKLALLINGFKTFATKARAIDRQIAARLLK